MGEVSRAVRSLLRVPGWSLVMVGMLGAGTAAVVLVLAVMSGTLFGRMPYPSADRLAMIWMVREDGSSTTVSPADYLDFAAAARSFSELGANNYWFPTISGDGDPQRVSALQVTPSLLRMLGARAELGRLFSDEETVTGRTGVVILSHAFWQRRYGGNANVLGQRMRLSGTEYEIIGVLGHGWIHPEPHVRSEVADVYVPFAQDEWASNRGRFLRVVGRLAPGVTVEAARREISELAGRFAREHADTNAGRGGTVIGLRDQLFGPLRPVLLLALSAAALLFVIVCANAANLMLVRALGRRREFAVRTALGASRMQLVRQLSIEAGVLAVAGGLVGLALHAGALQLLRGQLSRFLPPLANLTFDLRLALLTLALILLAALLLSLLSIGEVQRSGARHVLNEESAGGGGGSRVLRLRRLLVAGEIALTVALVSGAGLLSRSFVRLSRVDPGFDPSQVLTAELTLPAAGYADGDAVRAYYDALAERLRSLPAVTAVAYISDLPLVTGENRTRRFEVLGRDQPPSQQPDAEYQVVSPGYFETMRMRLVTGRGFTADDRVSSTPVVVVNEAAAALFWPGEPAAGRRLRWTQADTPVDVLVTGVVANVLDNTLTGEPDPFVYYPLAQQTGRRMNVVIRTSAPPSSVATAIRSTIRDVDPAVVVDDFSIMLGRVRDTIAAPRATAALASMVSGLALLIAALGIYGIVAYEVQSRTREFGIRLALGAERGGVLQLVLRRALLLTGSGLALGLALALLGARLMRSFLFGIGAADPLTFLGAALLLGATGLLAALGPARRALRVEPVQALRYLA